MKSALLLLSLLPLAVSAASEFASSDSEDRPRLEIVKSVLPVLPMRAIETGVTEGDCHVVVSVDSDGNLADYLVIAYSQPSLAETSVAAIKQWKFAPPRWHGQPISIQREIEIHFENHGAVISVDMASYYDTFLSSIFSTRYAYRPRTLKELDRIPTPINAAKPVAPKGVSGMIVVEFFIDETGSVRLPSILHTGDQTLGAAAVAAVREWKFEPPTVQGRPVLVRARQTFRFQP